MSSLRSMSKKSDAVMKYLVSTCRYQDGDDLPEQDQNTPPLNGFSSADRDSITVVREPATAGPPDRDAAMPDTQAVPQWKYRLASDLIQTSSIAQVGKKIMDTPVQLSVHDVPQVSSEVLVICMSKHEGAES